MHLLDSVRSHFICVPFAHEVGAAIATEYHNESLKEKDNKAFCLVTAGPGLTNTVTALAGAWQESRELLIIGGQVKNIDLADKNMRQRGIQEVDGCKLVESITKHSFRLTSQKQLGDVIAKIKDGYADRKGPVFIEIPLDVQAQDVKDSYKYSELELKLNVKVHSDEEFFMIERTLKNSKRPIILIGGGIKRHIAEQLSQDIENSQLPIMTTYNGADKVNNESSNFFGRPNTWGMRYSNILIQQSDFILALGTRLGLQQTGFNWQEFAPNATLVHVDIDKTELEKGHPKKSIKINCDANRLLLSLINSEDFKIRKEQKEWLEFCKKVKKLLPLQESCNTTKRGYIKPYKFWEELSKHMKGDSILVPCSSGSSFTSSYQAVTLPKGSIMISNKSQASMGYGLSGAIGAAIANPNKKVFLVEGDGGFLQNVQELASARRNTDNLGIYIWINNGYASIRMTQKTYFNGAWLGCDEESGLGFPQWEKLFESFDIPLYCMNENYFADKVFQKFIAKNGTYAVIVNLDPEQTFFPKISSKVSSNGGMVSSPLHEIGPPLSPELQEICMKYFKK